jgi:hypothetical protein
MSKKKATTIILYLSFLFISFIYINNVLKKDEVSILEEEEEKKLEKEYPVTVTLKLLQGDQTREYERTTTNFESVEEFLGELRSKDGLLFEITKFTYGPEITTVFGKEPQEGYKWALFLENRDVTNIMDDIDVDKNQTYELKMVKKE